MATENYNRWEVWKLEKQLETLGNKRDEIRAEMKLITEIRDQKLRNGESQINPHQAPWVPKPTLRRRIASFLGGIPLPVPPPPRAPDAGPDQVIGVGKP